MFSCISSAFVFLFLFFATLAAATQTVTVTTCNTGGLFCCNQVQVSNTSAIGTLLGLLGVVVSPITALVGANCSFH
ncbi:hypothetical protein B0H34DRAFT_696799 [Crassisporium funariophilum]|nr:hypothetical protein B0H34DRAFT_739204 [Crassisporium funariophilum]KAF8163778.1 hypothetical protein B0H34DRAFT_696799 [Crassisporium funariophilum]